MYATVRWYYLPPMASPFIYEDPLPPEELADRRNELAQLRDRIGDARNSRLEGARRFGKTSLLMAALWQAEQDGLIQIYVNFLGVLTLGDVSQRIELAYSEALDGPLKRWITGVIATLRPTVTAAPGGVGVSVAPQVQQRGLLERLALPRQLHERHGRQCAIAFDEFQDVVRIGPEAPATIRSELEKHRTAAAYTFSGSHPGLMRDLFSDRRQAFFAQAAAIELPRLPADELAEYIDDRFRRADRDPGDALAPLLDLANGHPQRAMLLAHHLYEATQRGQPATGETWLRTRATAQHAVTGEVEADWANLSRTERKVISIISERSITLGGAEARGRYKLSKGGSNSQAVENLQRNGHIERDERTATGWRVVDPMLERWLAAGRAWPA
jgi:uncharacterized protein